MLKKERKDGIIILIISVFRRWKREEKWGDLMKYFIKIASTLCILLICFTIPSYATLSWNSIKGQAEQFITNGSTGNSYINSANTAELVNGLANILTTIGVTVVLAGLLIIGIKYMVATPEEAAKLKTKLVGLAISGVVIMGAYGIWNLAYIFFNAMTMTK